MTWIWILSHLLVHFCLKWWNKTEKCCAAIVTYVHGMMGWTSKCTEAPLELFIKKIHFFSVTLLCLFICVVVWYVLHMSAPESGKNLFLTYVYLYCSDLKSQEVLINFLLPVELSVIQISSLNSIQSYINTYLRILIQCSSQELYYY